MTFFKISRAVVYPLHKFLWPTTVVGTENLEKFKGGIIISNHYATPDSIIIACRYFKDYFHALVKSESFKTKIGNWFLRLIGCIPVHRGEADIVAYKQVLTTLKNKENILIFPEGTRNKAGTKELAPFKEGVSVFAMRANVEILPMLYYRMHKIWRRNILIIGEPIDLNALGFTRHQDVEATQYLREKMLELRTKVDAVAKENGLE